MNYTTKQVDAMKETLETIFNDELNYQDAIIGDGLNDLEDGMITYSVVGFEAYATLPLSTAYSTGSHPLQLIKAFMQVVDDSLLEDNESYIDMCVSVNLATNKIESRIAVDTYHEAFIGCIENSLVFSETIDLENFEQQCKKAVAAL